MNKELWLVRHGRTAANAEGVFSGWLDVALTPEGREQAAALQPRLAEASFDGVWSSDLQRAVETARLAFGEPVQDERLREMHFGELEGLPWDRVSPEHARGLMTFKDFAPPGGETIPKVRERLLAFIDSLAPGRHLIFSHGGAIRVLTAHLGEDRFVGNAEVLVVHF